MKLILLLGLLVLGVARGSSGACEVKSQRTYTTTDASVLTNIAYITEFEYSCGKASENLYGEVQATGALLQLARTLQNSFLLSWTEEVGLATKGDHVINLYSEEGYNSLRKAQKSGSGGSNVVPQATLTLNHPGAYNGPWLNSEHLAAILGVVVGYLAISSKSKLLA